jgi:hypothetical protein
VTVYEEYEENENEHDHVDSMESFVEFGDEKVGVAAGGVSTICATRRLQGSQSVTASEHDERSVDAHGHEHVARALRQKVGEERVRATHEVREETDLVGEAELNERVCGANEQDEHVEY